MKQKRGNTWSMPKMTSALRCVFTVIVLSSSFSQANSGEDNAETVASKPLVRTNMGIVTGLYAHSQDHNIKFSQFLGIPYAIPPIRDLRFKPPLANSEFYSPREPLKAEKFPSECTQIDLISKKLTGSEDCLYLNIFTPELEFNANPLYPVIVWIHGGNFGFGSASPDFYGPERFVEQDVVMVTLNYRLGVLGFASTGDTGIPPNLGLMDQQMALTWVKENIQQFGGDPDKVTLMGESAGATSVMAHMASPRAHGLFQAGIAMSGTWGFQPYLHKSHGLVHNTKLLAMKVGCKPTNDSSSLVTCLRTKSDAELVNAANEMSNRYGNLPIPFSPVAETVGERSPVTTAPLINPWAPQGRNKVGGGANIPLIIGSNLDAGLSALLEFIKNEELFKAVEDDFAVEGPVLLLGTDPDAAREDEGESATAETMRTFYLKDNSLSLDNIVKIKDMVTDAHFLAPIDLTVKQIVESRKNLQNPASVYYYNYQHEGSFTLPMAFDIMDVKGSCQADELFLMFKNSQVSGHWIGDIALQTEEDIIVSKKLIEMWTDFAKTGNPTPQSKSWKPVKTEQVENESVVVPSYAVIDNEDLRMDYPENFALRMTTVQNLFNLMERHRNFNKADHPQFYELKEAREQLVQDGQDADPSASADVATEPDVPTPSEPVEEPYNLQEEMRKLLAEEAEVTQDILNQVNEGKLQKDEL